MIKRLITLLASFPHVRLWYLVLFLLSVASILDVPGAPVFGMSKVFQIFFIVTVSALKASLLIIIAACLWKYKPARVILVFLLALYTLIAIVNVCAFSFYGFGMSRKLVALIAQTNPSEASEFIPDIISHLAALLKSPLTWCWVIIATIFTFLFCKLSRRIIFPVIITLSISGLLVIGWFFLSFDTGRTSVLMSARIPKYFFDQRRWNMEMQKRIDNKMSLPYPETVKSEKITSNFIVIIGESANRPNLSLYGYPLQTSPCMDEMKDSLFVFTDAIASSLITSGNLERLISFKSDDRVFGDWYNYPSVIDLFNSAGYTTYWLSNQERAGVWSNAVGALASGADVSSFVGMEYCDDALLSERTFDDALLPALRNSLSDNADYRMIFMHLLGSHVIYNRRFPAERVHFSDEDVRSKLNYPWLNDEGAQLLADYSNSLVFTDSIWNESVKLISGSSEPSLLLYLSDHGEKVCVSDNMRGRDSRSAEIPFVIYVNDAFRNANPDLIDRLERAKDRPFSSANLVYILMTLTGTQYQLYNGADDPLSDEFVARTRLVDEVPWEHDHKY